MCRLLLLFLVCAPPAHAGLYYSGETFADLPSRWRGYLLDQRALRQIAVKPTATVPASLLRKKYEQEADRLTKLAAARALTADEAADLGALLVRLGDAARAVEVLRPAQRTFPVHFRLAANLGTAWQVQGDLSQAAAALEQAVSLAPGKHAQAEKLHLKLVRLRGREKPGTQSLDQLFDVSFVGPSGRFEAGQLAQAEQKKLPDAAIALVQQLGLWLPGDARLLWQMAELANAQGDVAVAAAMLDGCVTEYGLRSADLQAHRKITRVAADSLSKAAPVVKADHEAHTLLFKPRSSRPLVSKTGLDALPPIDPKGLNALAWEMISETTVDRQARPTFAKYLRELDGKQVILRGYVQPLGDDTDLGAFLLVEHPVGCWYCEMPEVNNIVLIELPEGKSGRYTRDRVKITGKLTLNATDPENFLYTIRDAKMADDSSE